MLEKVKVEQIPANMQADMLKGLYIPYLMGVYDTKDLWQLRVVFRNKYKVKAIKEPATKQDLVYFIATDKKYTPVVTEQLESILFLIKNSEYSHLLEQGCNGFVHKEAIKKLELNT